MKKTQTYRNTLIQKLNQFGLDPEEWFIDSEAGFFNTLLLINKVDPQFRLIGEKTRSGWKSIQVLSI